jgi:hypothetical protein
VNFNKLIRVRADESRFIHPDLEALLPKVIPAGWQMVKGGKDGDDGAMYANKGLRLSLIISFAREADGKRWAHLSVASPDYIPTWERMRDVKQWFFPDRRALMILPPVAEYVNIHERCLHLWICLDDDGLPDFTSGTGSI